MKKADDAFTAYTRQLGSSQGDDATRATLKMLENARRAMEGRIQQEKDRSAQAAATAQAIQSVQGASGAQQPPVNAGGQQLSVAAGGFCSLSE